MRMCLSPQDKLRPGRVPKLDGDAEARLVLLECSHPPVGHSFVLKMLELN